MPAEKLSIKLFFQSFVFTFLTFFFSLLYYLLTAFIPSFSLPVFPEIISVLILLAVASDLLFSQLIGCQTNLIGIPLPTTSCPTKFQEYLLFLPLTSPFLIVFLFWLIILSLIKKFFPQTKTFPQSLSIFKTIFRSLFFISIGLTTGILTFLLFSFLTHPLILLWHLNPNKLFNQIIFQSLSLSHWFFLGLGGLLGTFWASRYSSQSLFNTFSQFISKVIKNYRKIALYLFILLIITAVIGRIIWLVVDHYGSQEFEKLKQEELQSSP